MYLNMFSGAPNWNIVITQVVVPEPALTDWSGFYNTHGAQNKASRSLPGLLNGERNLEQQLCMAQFNVSDET